MGHSELFPLTQIVEIHLQLLLRFLAGFEGTLNGILPRSEKPLPFLTEETIRTEPGFVFLAFPMGHDASLIDCFLNNPSSADQD
jgi:hypothetical protein